MLLLHQATELLQDYQVGVIEHSGKMMILMDILAQSVSLHEKLLVFRYNFCPRHDFVVFS